MRKPADFDVRHRWRLQCQPEELTAVVLDTERYRDWCSRVVLDCEIVDPGRPDGLGTRFRVHTKGWLPYSFLFTVEYVDLIPHRQMTVRVTGDFQGFGYMKIDRQQDGCCELDLRWLIDLHHPVLVRLRPVLYPLMMGNHRWAAGWVRRLLQAELNRRKAGDGAINAPGPTFGWFLALIRPLRESRARTLGWRRGGPGNADGVE